MKLFHSYAILSAILWNFASGSSVAGQVFLYGASQKPSDLLAVDLSTARSVFAQILGLSQFYALDPSNERSIEYIDGFGSPSVEVFGESRKSSGSALVIVEGFSSHEGDYAFLFN